MVRYAKSDRRTKRRRHQRTGGIAAGAGLFTFFEDSSMGVKVSPITTVIFSVILITVVVFANMGVFDWIF